MRKRPDWLIALAMIVGGSVFAAPLPAVYGTTWSAVVGGLLFWPGALLAALLVCVGEK